MGINDCLRFATSKFNFLVEINGFEVHYWIYARRQVFKFHETL